MLWSEVSFSTNIGLSVKRMNYDRMDFMEKSSLYEMVAFLVTA